MVNKARLFDKLIKRDVPIKKKPLIEILGDDRVLIENYCKVFDYQPHRVVILVCFGEVCVDGCGLAMAYMSAEQLIISGKIERVSLCRR